jgi:lipopolysaccharide transport system permease protein
MTIKQFEINSENLTYRMARWDLYEGIKQWGLWGRLSTNEIKRRYRRTLLGPSWVTLSLLIFSSALSIVWAGLWNQEVKTYLPFLLAGMIPWTMLSASIAESCATFLSAEPLIKNTHFPYSILIWGLLLRNLIIFGHNIVGFILVAAICGVPLNIYSLLLLPGLILMIINAGWISLLVAIACLRYRDFQQITISLIQLCMFITPIFWDVSQLAGKRIYFAKLNLFYHLLHIIKEPMLGKLADIDSYFFAFCAALIGWAIAYLVYAQNRKKLAYWF